MEIINKWWGELVGTTGDYSVTMTQAAEFLVKKSIVFDTDNARKILEQC
jgi:hypothetical protein